MGNSLCVSFQYQTFNTKIVPVEGFGLKRIYIVPLYTATVLQYQERSFCLLANTGSCTCVHYTDHGTSIHSLVKSVKSLGTKDSL